MSAAAASAARTKAVAAKSHDGGVRRAAFPVAIAVALAFAAASVVSRLTAGCRVDASASHPLDSASASKCTTSAYRGPIASCLLAPLLPFVSRSPAGCCIACCRVPPPCVTFCCAATARVHPRPLLFICGSWLSRRISSHRPRLLMRHRLTTGCVKPSLMCRRFCRHRDCYCHPRCIPSSWRHRPRRHRCQHPSPSSSLSYPVALLPWSCRR